MSLYCVSLRKSKDHFSKVTYIYVINYLGRAEHRTGARERRRTLTSAVRSRIFIVATCNNQTQSDSHRGIMPPKSSDLLICIII